MRVSKIIKRKDSLDTLLYFRIKEKGIYFEDYIETMLIKYKLK